MAIEDISTDPDVLHPVVVEHVGAQMSDLWGRSDLCIPAARITVAVLARLGQGAHTLSVEARSLIELTPGRFKSTWKYLPERVRFDIREHFGGRNTQHLRAPGVFPGHLVVITDDNRLLDSASHVLTGELGIGARALAFQLSPEFQSLKEGQFERHQPEPGIEAYVEYRPKPEDDISDMGWNSPEKLQLFEEIADGIVEDLQFDPRVVANLPPVVSPEDLSRMLANDPRPDSRHRPVVRVLPTFEQNEPALTEAAAIEVDGPRRDNSEPERSDPAEPSVEQPAANSPLEAQPPSHDAAEFEPTEWPLGQLVLPPSIHGAGAIVERSDDRAKLPETKVNTELPPRPAVVPSSGPAAAATYSQSLWDENAPPVLDHSQAAGVADELPPPKQQTGVATGRSKGQRKNRPTSAAVMGNGDKGGTGVDSSDVAPGHHGVLPDNPATPEKTKPLEEATAVEQPDPGTRTRPLQDPGVPPTAPPRGLSGI